MEFTANYNLKKPDGNDAYDKSNDNSNMDTIDAAMKQNETNGVPYGVDTSSSANIITVAVTPAPTAYADGYSIRVKVANTSTGAATLNVNDLGAVDVKNSDGSAIGAGDLQAGIPRIFTYVGGASPAFIASGSGGLSGAGNATAADVLSPYTFTSASGKAQAGSIPTVNGGNSITPGPTQQTAVVSNSYVKNAIVVAGVSFAASKLLTGTTVAGTAGTMPNNGTLNYSPSTASQSIPAGYTLGGTISAVGGNASDAQVLSGYGYSSANGIGRTGSMPNNGAPVFNPSTSTQQWGAGYVSSITVNPVGGNATDGTVLSGQTYSSAAGINRSGTMTNYGNVTLLPGQSSGAGYYSSVGASGVASASGSVYVDGSIVGTLVTDNGTAAGYSYTGIALTVTGLSFTPKRIRAWSKGGPGGNNVYVILYDSDIQYGSQSNCNCLTGYWYYGNSAWDPIVFQVGAGIVKVSNGSFTLPVTGGDPATYAWEAYAS